MHKTFSPFNSNAITKRNLVRFFGRWGRTKMQALIRFGVQESKDSKPDERLELRFNLILATLFRKGKIGEDQGLIYASVNNNVNADVPVPNDFEA